MYIYIYIYIYMYIYADLSVICFECCTLQFNTLFSTQTSYEYQNVNVEARFLCLPPKLGYFLYLREFLNPGSGIRDSEQSVTMS